MYSKGYQAADKDHQSAYATHQTAEEHYRKCVTEETVEDALGCYKDAYNTDREQERAEDDLDAQREMANWAEGMLWATLFIGTVTAAVTALGVMYVAKTLGATSETLEAARATNEIMRDEQRPWVQLRQSYTFFDKGGEKRFKIGIKPENLSNFPAHKVRISVQNFSGGKETLNARDMAAIALTRAYDAPVFRGVVFTNEHIGAIVPIDVILDRSKAVTAIKIAYATSYKYPVGEKESGSTVVIGHVIVRSKFGDKFDSVLDINDLDISFSEIASFAT